jgi:hypothetical protein
VLVSPIVSNRYMLESSSNRHECQPVTNEWLAVKDGCSVILAYTSLLNYVQMVFVTVLHRVGNCDIARNNKKKLYHIYYESTASTAVIHYSRPHKSPATHVHP